MALAPECDWLLADQDQNLSHAAKHLLDCRWEDACKLFSLKNREDPNYASGLCLVSVLQYLTSFEDDHKQKALKTLENAESLFKSPNSPPKKLVQQLLNSKSDLNANINDIQLSNLCAEVIELYLDNLQADCSLFQAMISIMAQDVTGFIKGGWSLRKALKSYEKSFKAAKQLYSTFYAEDTTFASIDETFEMTEEHIPNGPIHSQSEPGLSEKLDTRKLSTDSENGELFHSTEDLSTVVHSPVVFSTGEGISEAEKLIEQMSNEHNTTLLLFFRGRVARLTSQLQDGIKIFDLGLNCASEQRELQIIFCYELGFAHTMALNYTEASAYFEKLITLSRWAPPFNVYVFAVAQGCLGNLSICKENLLKAPTIVRTKSNPLEGWVLARCKLLNDNWNIISTQSIQLHCLELLYLWNSIHYIPENLVKLHLKYCMQFLMQEKTVNFWTSLCNLLQGALFMKVDKIESAKKSFEAAILAHESLVKQGNKLDNQVIAFASYEMACLMKKMDNIYESKVWINKAKALCKGFKMENRLSMRIHAFSD